MIDYEFSQHLDMQRRSTHAGEGDLLERHCQSKQGPNRSHTMNGMRHVAERLVLRCHEAIMQLELSIQQNMCEYDPNNRDGFIQIQEYYSFLARLTSLKLRAEHVRGSLHHEEKDPNDVCVEYETLENLIYEFQDITLSLNEFARTHGSPAKSARSQSSKESSIMPLRPLRIVERNRDSVELTAAIIQTVNEENEEKLRLGRKLPFLSPKKTVKFMDRDLNDMVQIERLKRSSSLPGSPIPETLIESELTLKENRTLRMAKSYDVGLNDKKKTANFEFFKNKNRLSLSVFDEIDTDASDEETVISVSPPAMSNYLLKTGEQKATNTLRRYNSHETAPTIESPCLSKDLLTQLIEPSPNAQRSSRKSWFESAKTMNLASSFFNKWFTSENLVTKEIGNPNTTSPSRVRSIIKNKQPLASNNHSSSIVIGPNGNRFIRGLNDPLVTCTISYDELQDALNTEFKF
ncbi:hypothetical protein C6P41_004136 [Kluyveromyces marxianus]|nr:hypothetical protein C6P43_004700 [Kluyveromyces marxianus]KAG0681761.1 hypothetical protein C6P41_004136 [Kluyveromyces marxianus]